MEERCDPDEELEFELIDVEFFVIELWASLHVEVEDENEYDGRGRLLHRDHLGQQGVDDLGAVDAGGFGFVGGVDAVGEAGRGDGADVLG